MNIKKIYLILIILLFLSHPFSYFINGENIVSTKYPNKVIMDQQFSISNIPSSNPPKTPTGRPFLNVDWDYVFETSNVHPNPNPKVLDIAYYFDWGDGTNTGWFGPLESGQTCMAVHKYSALGAYEIKAKSCFIYYDNDWDIYRYGVHSDFSEPFVVNVRKYPIFDQIFFFIRDLLKSYF